jgi:hypothetical protein
MNGLDHSTCAQAALLDKLKVKKIVHKFCTSGTQLLSYIGRYLVAGFSHHAPLFHLAAIYIILLGCKSLPCQLADDNLEHVTCIILQSDS